MPSVTAPDGKVHRMDTNAELTKLQQQQTRTNTRISNLEAEQRRAGQTLAVAREAVAQFHRRGGGRTAEQNQLEQALAEAKAAVDEPWAERIDGARRAARDARAATQRFIGEHLTELVQPVEADAEIAVAEMTAACQALIAAYTRREAAVQQISALASQVGQIQPGDVGPSSRAETLIREANRLLLNGESTPHLRHDPRLPRDGSIPAGAEPEAAVA